MRVIKGAAISLLSYRKDPCWLYRNDAIKLRIYAFSFYKCPKHVTFSMRGSCIYFQIRSITSADELQQRL